MDTGAPATERGQQRRISLMILLMVVLTAATLAYGMLDPGRAKDAEHEQKIEAANHGASLFARNCAGCHGIRGQGLIGPALNKPDNRPDDTATRDAKRDLFQNTITCGRVGTGMPAWGQSQKGPLNDFQIGQLVTLITTQGDGGAADEAYWDHAEELWKELNPGLDGPAVAVPSINQQACGQYAPGAAPTSTATASPTATPSGTPEPPATSFEIVATDNAFDKTALTVPVGQEISITVTNNGAALHNLHVQNEANVATGFLAGGASETIKVTFASAGTFNFLCDLHPGQMMGTITAQ